MPSPASFNTAAHRTPAAIATAWLESLRIHQWLKNTLVFVPLAAAHRLGEQGRTGAALRAFLAFSLVAASVYVANDLMDVQTDLSHPHKRNRAIASGRLPRPLALVSIPALIVGALLLTWSLPPRFGAALGIYFLLMMAYSAGLKSIVLLDALVLAAGYALRVVAGGAAVHIGPSARLLGFCIFLFFSLALIKRYSELTLRRRCDGPAAHARAYLLQDLDFILALGCSSGILSVLVLVMYLSSGDIGRLYSRYELIWATAVLLLYWVSHMWLMAHRGRMSDDPLVFAIKNPVSLALIALMGTSAWLAV